MIVLSLGNETHVSSYHRYDVHVTDGFRFGTDFLFLSFFQALLDIS